MRELTVLGWAGMRGVVSLALALALPLRAPSGALFPRRSEIILLTYMVILATLVLQGLTLGRVVRATGVADPRAAERGERRAREAATRSAKELLAAYEASSVLDPAQRESLRQWFDGAARLDRKEIEEDGVLAEARGSLLAAELDVVIRLRDQGEISDEIATRLEAELEIEIVRLRDGSESGLA